MEPGSQSPLGRTSLTWPWNTHFLPLWVQADDCLWWGGGGGAESQWEATD
jgi:hypothetical protein